MLELFTFPFFAGYPNATDDTRNGRCYRYRHGTRAPDGFLSLLHTPAKLNEAGQGYLDRTPKIRLPEAGSRTPSAGFAALAAHPRMMCEITHHPAAEMQPLIDHDLMK